MSDTRITTEERAALERLLVIAGRDTGTSKRCADLLLAWWNARECGGFDFVDLWSLDPQTLGDALMVIGLIARTHSYIDAFGYEPVMQGIISQWRPVARGRRKTWR